MSTSIDDAIQAASAQHADTTEEDLKTAHGDVVVLAGEVSLWVKTILAEADKARADKDLDGLDDLEDILRDVKIMLDKKADQSTRTGRHSDKKPGRGKRVITWLNTPRS